MKVLCIEGLANHIGPESCISVRKGDGEALTGERAGWVLSCEINAPPRGGLLWLLKGRIKVADDFSMPLDDAVLGLFEGR